MALGPAERLELLAGGGVPNLDGLIEAAGDDVFAVGREGGGINRLGMSLEGGGDAGRGRGRGRVVGPRQGDGQGAEEEDRQGGEAGRRVALTGGGSWVPTSGESRWERVGAREDCSVARPDGAVNESTEAVVPRKAGLRRAAEVGNICGRESV